MAGVSFAGGLSTSAAGRPGIRDKVAFVLSFGGHGDLPRVMHYLATGEETPVPGVAVHPPHDYGVAVILYALADRGVVPAEQVSALRDGVRTFLLASQLTLVNMEQANATFAKARDMAAALPEPSRTYMDYVNDRAVDQAWAGAGAVSRPVGRHRSRRCRPSGPRRPSRRCSCCTATRTRSSHRPNRCCSATRSRAKGANVRVLLSRIITHAELDRSGDYGEAGRLVAFWADLLGR